MAPRDRTKFPAHVTQLDNMSALFRRAAKRPHIGVTQGGSSRKNPGAKVAATDGIFRPKKRKKRL